MTNEEYLRSANKEELAEILFNVYDDGVVCGEWNACGNGCCQNSSEAPTMLVQEDFLDWLGQIHKGDKSVK